MILRSSAATVYGFIRDLAHAPNESQVVPYWSVYRAHDLALVSRTKSLVMQTLRKRAIHGLALKLLPAARG